MTLHEKIKLWEREEGAKLFHDLGLPKDAVILDYGCGFGHYTFAASRFLGGTQGKVYAVDINKVCLNWVAQTAQEEGLANIQTAKGNAEYRLEFPDQSLDMLLCYDILHGEGDHRFRLYEEARRTLKPGGILSILPFHLSNFRDRDGKKKTYTYPKLVSEANEYGFGEMEAMPIGIHFEKVHSKYYIHKGGVEFEALETAKIVNLKKKES
ncbi:class I SAM-dependent methyltransferase [Gorillibacterium sp. CAU 1737]|uniref:class I SAM-dependent methyltransferase n=1 Tax=Gorillibacterium sp. CAU 1737 TaxID=3140362 RepID=UPI003261694B